MADLKLFTPLTIKHICTKNLLILVVSISSTYNSDTSRNVFYSIVQRILKKICTSKLHSHLKSYSYNWTNAGEEWHWLRLIVTRIKINGHLMFLATNVSYNLCLRHAEWWFGEPEHRGIILHYSNQLCNTDNRYMCWILF